MTGTDKQIKWAQDIINERLGTCDANIKLSEERYQQYGTDIYKEDAECYKIIKTALEALFADPKMQDAATIINRRDALPDASALISKAETIAHNKGLSKIDACKMVCGVK